MIWRVLLTTTENRDRINAEGGPLACTGAAPNDSPSSHPRSLRGPLEQHGIKQTSFDKDTAFLDKKLTRIMYGFASGTKLILPSEEAEERVKLTNQPNGEVTVEFTDRLTDMKGR